MHWVMHLAIVTWSLQPKIVPPTSGPILNIHLIIYAGVLLVCMIVMVIIINKINCVFLEVLNIMHSNSWCFISSIIIDPLKQVIDIGF